MQPGLGLGYPFAVHGLLMLLRLMGVGQKRFRGHPTHDYRR